MSRRANDSSAIVYALASRLWLRECERLGLDPRDERIAGPLRLVPPADELAVAGVPAGWSGIAWASEQHLAAMPQRERSRRGAFYTPPGLAEVLAARAADGPLPAEGLLADPACGAGALLAALAARIGRTQAPEDAVRLVATRLRGTDVDPVAVGLAEFAVRIALLPTWSQIDDRARPALPPIAETADGLSDVRAAAVVIANPPFGRVSLTAEQRDRHGAALYGHAHWPTLFLHASIERLSPGGRAAFVLPASLVGGAYYQRLRAFLVEHAPPSWLAFVPDRAGVFAGDVLQEALLAVFERGRTAGDVTIEEIAFSTRPQRHACRLDGRGAGPWLLPRRPEDVALVDAARQRKHRLRDYGWQISTGPFVWNRHKNQLHQRPRPGRLPVIWASDLRNGRVDGREPRSGRFVEPLPGQEWLVLESPAVLVQRTTAPEQERRLVAAVVDRDTLEELGGRVVVENHLNVCTWDGTGDLTPARLLAWLTSEETDRLYRCLTGSVAVSAFELNALPLPPPAAVRALAGDVDRDERQAA